MREIADRRAAVVAAVREVAPLEFVNGGGTGSLERTAAEEAVTEIAAGSGLYDPVLFDGYRSLELRPAAGFALPVSRRPGPGVVTLLGGGYIASGAARQGPPAEAVPAAGAPLRPARGRRRGPDAGPRRGRGPAAGRRPGLPPPRQGGRALRALRRSPPPRGRGGRRRRPDLPRRGQGVPLVRPRPGRGPGRARGRCRRCGTGPRGRAGRGRTGTRPSGGRGRRASRRVWKWRLPQWGRPS